MSINFTIKIYDRFVPADTELLYHALFYQMAILHEKGCVCHALQLVYQMAGNHKVTSGSTASRMLFMISSLARRSMPFNGSSRR